MRIGVVGKYVNLPDAYLSVVEALRHAGFHHGGQGRGGLDPGRGRARDARDRPLRQLDGMVIPGGFGERGIEGKIAAARYAREHDDPCLGLCLGLQVMVIDVARHLAGLDGANSREFDPLTPHPVIDLMDDQHDVVDMGGTMRLGAYVAQLAAGLQVAKAYGTEVVSERHRHRYEVNTRFRPRLEEAGLVCSGESPDGRLVEFIELPGHPFWVGTQAHPEFKSRPDRPHPLFRELVGRRPGAGRGPPAAPARHRRRRRCRPEASGRRPTGRGFAACSARSECFRGWRISVVDAHLPSTPTASAFDRDIVRHPGAVAVVAVTERHTAVLVRQYRAALDRAVLEIPAGTRDVDGEPPELTAAARARGGGRGARRRHRAPGHHRQQPRVLRRGHRSCTSAPGSPVCRSDRHGHEEEGIEVVEVASAEVGRHGGRRASGGRPDHLGLLLARARLAASAVGGS